MVRDTPALHPAISTEERKYIEDSLAVEEEGEVMVGECRKQQAVPWGPLLSSPQVIAPWSGRLQGGEPLA